MGKEYVTDVPYMLDMWDYEQNIKDPSTVTSKNSNIFIWTCKKCGYSRPCSAKSVYLGKGKCPCCDSNKVIRAGVNDVLTRLKNFDKFYDFENNKGFDITTVGLDSSDSVNYRCPDCGREWNASVRSQVRKLPGGTYEAKGCPHYNTVKRKKDDVSFISDEPDIMRFFDYEKNKIDPKKTKSNAEQDVALKCSNCSYEWNTTIREFFRGKRKCKCCELDLVTKSGINDFLTVISEAASSLLSEENPDIDIHNLSVLDDTVVNWHCPVCDKKWPASVKSRVTGKKGSYKLRRCQNCYVHSKERITPISEVPWILKFYDISRNKMKPSDVSVNYRKPVFFKCNDCGFKWSANPKSRYDSKSKECPCCGTGKYIKAGLNDVMYLCPDITKILDETRNPGLDLSKEAPNSTKPYLFTCRKCNYEWDDTIKNRVRKGIDGEYHLRDCPNCSKKSYRAVPYDIEYPNVAKMYDCEANERPLSSITSYESNSLLLKWICPNCAGRFDARLQAIISSQSNSTKGCPYCSSTKLRKGESFGDIHSELLVEYDPTNEIDPFTVFPGCKDSVRWVCKNDKTHTWEASFAQRHSGQGNCRICNRTELFPEINSFAAVYPDFVKYWSPNNDRKPDEVFYNTSVWIKWICLDCDRDYPAPITDIVSGKYTCPYCEGRKAIPGETSLKALYPEIARFYSEKNINDADHVLPSVETDCLWECYSCGYEFHTTLKEMVERPYNCPYCDGRLAVPGKTSLAALYPEIARHYSDKNERDADHILPTVKTMVLWKCEDCEQEFNAYIQDMVDGNTDCPFCNGRMAIAGKTSFKAKHPELMHEWDELANYCLGIDPDQILDSYRNNVWWVCSKNNNHHYEMSPYKRLIYQKRHREPCLYCKGRRRKKIFNYA